MPAPTGNPAGTRGSLVGRIMVVGIFLLGVAGCSAGGATTSGQESSITSPSAAAAATASSTMSSPSLLTPANTDAAPSSAAPSSPGSTAAMQSAPAAAPAPAPGPLLLPASPPVAVSVPAIGINSSLIDLGRNSDGTIEVPSLDDPDSKPGWYTGSPTPGTLGPAIILGHIDSRQFGPGVFYSLTDLQPGDGIDVTRADGTVAQFTVDSVKTVPKSNFPTLEVYGNLDHAGLRLITCGGQFDPDARSYESNVIVFASLVGSRSA